MYFFETIKAKKQKEILLAALPYLKPFLDEFRHISKLEHGGEKAKALKAAQSELIKAEALLMNRKDDHAAQEVAISARIAASNAYDEARSEEIETGLVIIERVVENALSTHYNNVLNVLALFNNKSPTNLEDEKDIFELAEMLFEILESEKVVSFLSRLQQFKSKMRFDTLQK